MYRCPECDEEVDEEDVEFECPFCFEIDMGEGFYTCENCGTLFDYEGDLWECEFCHNEGTNEQEEKIVQQNVEEEYDDDDYCPECGELLDYASMCPYCGWPNNIGWIGEQHR